MGYLNYSQFREKDKNILYEKYNQFFPILSRYLLSNIKIYGK